MPEPLTEDQIIQKLSHAYRPGAVASTDGYAEYYASHPLTCAAVLMPLVWMDGEWHLLFTRRTETVENHKGQVSFPGGACDGDEKTPEETALREAEEEVGLRRGDVRLLGRLNDILTITMYRVTPVVGVIPWPYEFRLAPAEVGRVFTLPLSWLADRENWDEYRFTPSGEQRSFPVITYHKHDGEILWGASARMTQNFLGVLGLLKA